MIIDFRVRAPFAAYETSPLFRNWQQVEIDTRSRVGVPISDSVKQFSMELLFKEAEAAGIGKMVVPMRKGLGVSNDAMVELLKRYPDKFVGLAGIDLVDVNKSLKEIETYVKNGPCKAIVMEPGQDPQPWYVDSGKAFQIFSYCERNDIPIVLTYGGIYSDLKYYDPVRLDEAVKAFPKANFCIMHGGFPYVTQVSQIAINRHNLYIAPDIYFMHVPGSADYAMAANYTLKERIIYSSAYPILPLKEAREAFEAALLPEVKPLVLGENAARFLKL